MIFVKAHRSVEFAVSEGVVGGFCVNVGKNPLGVREGKAPVVKLKTAALVTTPFVAVWENIEYVVLGSIPAT